MKAAIKWPRQWKGEYIMSDKMDAALQDFDLFQEIGIRLVPQRPTRDMCRAGCAAGDIDPETVRRVYNAMLVAAADACLHGDSTLN
jgi:hypothetical protein